MIQSHNSLVCHFSCLVIFPTITSASRCFTCHWKPNQLLRYLNLSNRRFLFSGKCYLAIKKTVTLLCENRQCVHVVRKKLRNYCIVRERWNKKMSVLSVHGFRKKSFDSYQLKSRVSPFPLYSGTFTAGLITDWWKAKYNLV